MVTLRNRTIKKLRLNFLAVLSKAAKNLRLSQAEAKKLVKKLRLRHGKARAGGEGERGPVALAAHAPKLFHWARSGFASNAVGTPARLLALFVQITVPVFVLLHQ